ncbi:hypothetical protein [Muricomes intestini]|uniref:hypothetical protein n=1 Tax=Muricomes intestini TaxID=1796634 RepID=UPI002FE1C594
MKYFTVKNMAGAPPQEDLLSSFILGASQALSEQASRSRDGCMTMGTFGTTSWR